MKLWVEPGEKDKKNLKKNGTKKSGLLLGAALITSSRFIVRTLGLLSTLILARLLVPEDFGLVAVASSIIGFLEMFTDLGFNQALIRFQDVSDDDYSTAWTLNVYRGILLSLLVFALSFPLSIFLHDDRLVLLLLIIAVLPFVNSLDNPRLLVYEKNLRFDVFFRVMVFTKGVGVITTISLAFIWHSYWALIVGMIVTSLMRVSLSHYYAPGRLVFTLKSWRKLVGFSGWLAGAQMLNALADRLDPIILATFTTPYVVGVLHVARELSYMTFTEVTIPLRRVVFPALSKNILVPSEFLYTYKLAVGGLFMVLSPICVGFVLVAPDAVPLILGDKWYAAIQPIQFMMCALTLSIVGEFAHSAAMAKGKPQFVFYQWLLVTPIKLTVYCLSVKWYGLYGAIYAICSIILMTTIIRLYISFKVTAIGFIKHLIIIHRSIISLVLMSSVVYFVSNSVFLQQIEYSPHLIRLLIMVVVGISIYSISSLLLWRSYGRPSGPEDIIVSRISSLMNTALSKINK